MKAKVINVISREIDNGIAKDVNVSAWSNIGIYTATININDIVGIQFQ